MTSIIISSDAVSVSEAVADEVAAKRQMTLIDRNFTQEIARRFGVRSKSITDLLDFTEKVAEPQRRLLNYLELGVLEKLMEDNIVCTGLGAHLYVTGISHILNVRVLSDLNTLSQQIATDKLRDPVQVRASLEKKMQKRLGNTKSAFGIDEQNPATYDMLFTLGKFDIPQVAKTIDETANERQFTAMTYSRKLAEDLTCASRVRLAIGKYSNLLVQVNDGTATLTMRKWFGWQKQAEMMREQAMGVTGVTDVRIQFFGKPEGSEPPTDNASA